MRSLNKSTNDNSRRVLMVGPTLQTRGGMASVLQLLADYWKPDQGRLRWVGTYEDGPVWWRVWVFVRGTMQFLWLLLMWRPHVVHLHFTWRGSFYRKAILAQIARITGCKVLMHAHGGRIPWFYESLSPRLKRCFITVLNRADRLIVLSDAWCIYYRSIGVTAPITVIPNPVVIPATPDKSDTATLHILSLGRLSVDKGTYDLLNAIPAVLEQVPDAQFWLCGDGDVEAVWRKLVGTNHASQVHVTGWIDPAARSRLLTQSSIYVQPSHAEGLPMAVLEAMAAGLPVVGMDVEGTRDLVADGENGLLVPTGDVQALAAAIVTLAKDVDLRTTYGAVGRQIVTETYDIEQVMEHLYTLYNTLA